MIVQFFSKTSWCQISLICSVFFFTHNDGRYVKNTWRQKCLGQVKSWVQVELDLSRVILGEAQNYPKLKIQLRCKQVVETWPKDCKLFSIIGKGMIWGDFFCCCSLNLVLFYPLFIFLVFSLMMGNQKLALLLLSKNDTMWQQKGTKKVS